MEGAATSAASLEAEQASGNIHQTEYTAVDSPLSEGNTSRSDEGRSATHELMDTDVQNVNSNDPSLGLGNTSRGREARMKLIQDLKDNCPQLEKDVLGLQKRTTKHGEKIKKLKKRLRYLESQQSSRKTQFRRLKKVGTVHRMSSSKAASLQDPPKQGRNEIRVSGEETTNAEGACADMHVDMDIGIDSGDNMDDDYVVADIKGNEAVFEDVNKKQVVEFPGENIELAKVV